jgi:hypothetical protein
LYLVTVMLNFIAQILSNEDATSVI